MGNLPTGKLTLEQLFAAMKRYDVVVRVPDGKEGVLFGSDATKVAVRFGHEHHNFYLPSEIDVIRYSPKGSEA